MDSMLSRLPTGKMHCADCLSNYNIIYYKATHNFVSKRQPFAFIPVKLNNLGRNLLSINCSIFLIRHLVNLKDHAGS